jgi:isopentenyl-diphosphate delta-isomerase type 1
MRAVADPHLAEGYARCAALTREHGTTYFWGAQLLPLARRRHVHAVYALARLADDIVDLPQAPGVSSAVALTEFETRFWGALAGGTSPDPVLAAIVHSVRQARIDPACFERFFQAMRTDLVQGRYETWGDLLGYMDGSAAVIGEMMLPVLGSDARALQPARALGLAFQLTNFLRDVDEDLDRGRVYVPQEDLRRFGADPARRVADEGWRDLMRFEIARNRRLYREADDGIPLLTGGARRCVATARVLYARILDRIEDADGDVFSGRHAVPTAAKAALAARMLVSRDPSRAVRRDRAAQLDPSGWVDGDPVQLVDEDGHPLAVATKSAIHHDDTPLHLAFSCYVIDTAGRVLVTERATDKRVFPAVTTNSFCGHPLPGEPLAEAVLRRGRSELGLAITAADLTLVVPEFRYRAASGHIWENELCPVYRAVVPADTEPVPDPREVRAASWVPWSDFTAAAAQPGALSPWSVDQVAALNLLGNDPLAWPAAPEDRLPPAARPRTQVAG